MSPKSAEQKAIEKQMKENQKIARDVARRERAAIIVNSAKFIDGFRVMDSGAEQILEIALRQFNGNDNNQVSISYDAVSKHLSNSLPLEAEKLLMYGMLSRYMILGKSVTVTLSERGMTYFDEKKQLLKEENSTCQKKRYQWY